MSSPAERTSNTKDVEQAIDKDDVRSKGSSASNKRKASKRLKDDWGTDIGKRIQSTASMLSDEALTMHVTEEVGICRVGCMGVEWEKGIRDQ